MNVPTTTNPPESKKPRVKAAMLDLSGTLHVGDRALSGAIDGVEELRKNGILLKFVTNTSKESRQSLLRRLRSLGFSVGDEEIHSSLTAARLKARKENLKPLLLLSDSALEEFVDDTDGNVANGRVGSVHGSEDFDSVIVGLAPDRFNHESMTTALDILLHGGRLIAINKGRYYKAEDGRLKAGVGCFVAGLEYGASVEAEIVGKPTPTFFEAALQTLRQQQKGSSLSSSSSSPLRNDEVVMIGDDFKDDILGARAVGCKGILVRTGKYRSGDGEKATATTSSCDDAETFLSPDAICDDFAEAVRLILDCGI